MSNPQEIFSAAQAKTNEGVQSATVTANEAKDNTVAAATEAKDKAVEAAQPTPEPNVFQQAGGQVMNAGQGAVDTVKNTLGFGEKK